MCDTDSCSLKPEVLECDIHSDTLSAYIGTIDPERIPLTDPFHTNMMVGFLFHLGFTKIKDLHSVVEKGWDHFLAFERDILKPTIPVSGLMAIYYALIIADPKARELFC